MHADDAPRHLLMHLYRNTIAALQPAPTVTRALDGIWDGEETHSPVHLLAIGKAATPMAVAAVARCDARRIAIAGGVVISHQSSDVTVGTLFRLTGDHPSPGARSEAAASALGEYVETRIAAGDRVIVLLSGGASALIGAPRSGIGAAQYTACVDALLGAGLTIDDMNTLRRKLSRWAGGRLGDALLARGARVNVLAISDVMSDNLAAIGSGPCLPDRSDRNTVEAIVTRASISSAIRDSLRALLAIAFADDAARPARVESEIPHQIVSSNSQAVASVLTLARAAGAAVLHGASPLRGDAHDCAVAISHEMRALRTALPENHGTTVVCWGGEPTVTLPAHNPPAGGRMQALALSVARALAGAGAVMEGITILAAGTDGRDGTTDAAGAIVDRSTWHAIACAGRDAARDLSEFRSHDALKTIDALIPSFSSGTNVNDLVIALIESLKA